MMIRPTHENFYERGARIQRDAETPEDAIRSYKRSCDLCCRYHCGDCDRCAIKEAHEDVMEVFEYNKKCYEERNLLTPKRITVIEY